MADSKCCFGCSNVRKGAWVIAIFDMLICILLTVRTFSKLNFLTYSSTPYSNKKVSHDMFSTHNSYGDDVSLYGSRTSSMEYDFNLFTQLFVLFLFFCVNLNLRKATHIHCIQSISHWLITSKIFFIFFILYVAYTTMRFTASEIIPIGVPVSIVVVYQLYIVKSFYDDELKFLSVSERNNGVQPVLRGPPLMTITSQVQSTAAYPIQSTTAYPVQSGPYVIQQVHQPIAPAPYPQQQYHPQTHQQQPAQPNHPHLVPETFAPQEYCNPPPYSPNYNMSEGPSVKQ